NYRGALPFDAAAIRKALDGADTVLLIGGPFFEEVWFAPGSPFTAGAAILQIEDSPERLARNFSLRTGLLASPAAGLRALRLAIERDGGPALSAAAAERNAALRALRAQDMTA